MFSKCSNPVIARTKAIDAMYGSYHDSFGAAVPVPVPPNLPARTGNIDSDTNIGRSYKYSYNIHDMRRS